MTAGEAIIIRENDRDDKMNMLYHENIEFDCTACSDNPRHFDTIANSSTKLYFSKPIRFWVIEKGCLLLNLMSDRLFLCRCCTQPWVSVQHSRSNDRPGQKLLLGRLAIGDDATECQIVQHGLNVLFGHISPCTIIGQLDKEQ